MLIQPVASFAMTTLSASSFASLLLQGRDAINTGHAIWLEVFCGAVAVFMFIIMAVLVAVAYGLYQAKQEVTKHLGEIKGRVYPLIDKSHSLVVELTPEIKKITAKTNEIMAKVDVITAHVEVIAGLAKDKAQEFSPTISDANETVKQANQTVRDANDRTRAQVDRVNGMVTETLDATARLGRAIERGIAYPGKEIAGLVAGAKATAEHLMHSSSGFGSLIGRLSGLFNGMAKPGKATPPSQAYRSMGSLPATSQFKPATHVPSPDSNAPKF